MEPMNRRNLIWILIGLLYFSRQIPGAFAEKYLTIDPASIVVLFGDPASANCSTNVTHTGMGWEGPTNTSVPKQEDVQLITWTVERLVEWEIQPICYININTTPDGQYEEILNVTVYKPFESVSISTVDNKERMTEGKPYFLKCDVKNVAPVRLLTVSWYKGQELLKTDVFSDENKHPANKTATLKITPLRSDDGVQYRCEAQLNLGPEGPQPPPIMTSDPLNITVYYGPEVSNCPEIVYLFEGESLAGYCNVTGNPFPDFSWWKDGLIIDPSFPLNRNSSGEYSFLVNAHLQILMVEVAYPPSRISELQPARVSAGEQVVLKCASKARPRPSYLWIYNRTMNVNINDEDGVSLLYINHAGSENTGTYTCIAYNDLGKTSQTVRVDVEGAETRCQLSFSSPDVRIEYGETVTVKCTFKHNASLSWEFANSTINTDTLVINSTSLSDFSDGNLKATCHGSFVGLDCQKELYVTVYKRPEKVSISAVDHAGPMIEGKNYTLRCDVQNVAPVHLLTVNWYNGKYHIQNESFISETEFLANKTATLTISPSRNDKVTSYSCDAELKLGLENFKVKSNPFNISVHYKPSIHKQLPQWVPVFHGYSEVLVCKASGYPEPTITWIFNNEKLNGETLTVKENAGEYTCIASNSVGNDTRVVNVVMKEDYLPLIAGVVALVVVIISGFFISIYSIYYKNTKTGRYTVEDAKPKAQNGNVAQNGKDSTIPMKAILV